MGVSMAITMRADTMAGRVMSVGDGGVCISRCSKVPSE